jgi:hypothetical protein
MTKVLSDILSAVDRGDSAILAVLELLVAFDTVDWFRSYLTDRQHVLGGGSRSAAVDIICGVPQELFPDLSLFVPYTANLPNLWYRLLHGLCIHQYADDSRM